MMNKISLFKFKPFSIKQQKLLTWWNKGSPVSHKNGIIADGAIRSGKTLAMSLSFVLWAMNTFINQNLGMAGKTIGSFRRNVLFWLKLMLRCRGYKVREYRSDNYIIVTRNEVMNYFYIFGGKDERSQDLIQGITLAGMLFDEVALMPESFVNQATGRCSVEGSTFWFNCNPESPNHWFYLNWIKKYKELDLLYLHFTMDDNLSMAEKIKERYKKMYSGIFYDRYIRGLWVVAEGLIYGIFANKPDRYLYKESKLPQFIEVTVGLDFGGNKSAHSLVATGTTKNYEQLIALKSERFFNKEYLPDGITPSKIDEIVVKFVGDIIKKYGRCDYLEWDNESTTLGNGIKKALSEVYPQVTVRGCYKAEIKDRIDLTIRLLGLDMFKYTSDCDTLVTALKECIFSPKPAEKGKDERLDNGSTDIDTLDAFEYTFTRNIYRFIRQ